MRWIFLVPLLLFGILLSTCAILLSQSRTVQSMFHDAHAEIIKAVASFAGTGTDAGSISSGIRPAGGVSAIRIQDEGIASAASPQAPTYEAYVISSSNAKVKAFRRRNHRSGIANDTTWFPSINGDDASIQREWMDLTGRRGVNATEYFKRPPSVYVTPHATGCFLSHWHVIRMVAERDERLRPDFVYMFEDDAACVPDLDRTVVDIIERLPSDWDLFYPGGKHFTEYVLDKNQTYLFHKKFNISRQEDVQSGKFKTFACSGMLGRGDSPLAPDGTRDLSLNQTYWRTLYTTNTEAYVINGKKIDKVAKLLAPSKNPIDPVDIVFADAMKSDKIRAYTAPRTLCHQSQLGGEMMMESPTPIEGYHRLFTSKYLEYIWDDLLYEECVGVY